MFFGSRAQDGQKQARFFYPRRGGIETSRVLTSGQANTLHILRQLQQQFQEQDRALTDTFKHVQFRDISFFAKRSVHPDPASPLYEPPALKTHTLTMDITTRSVQVYA